MRFIGQPLQIRRRNQFFKRETSLTLIELELFFQLA